MSGKVLGTLAAAALAAAALAGCRGPAAAVRVDPDLTCRNNLLNLGALLRRCLAENGGRFPEAMNHRGWVRLLEPYLPANPVVRAELLYCPRAVDWRRLTNRERARFRALNGPTSYIFNGDLAGRRPQDVPRPEFVLLLSEDDPRHAGQALRLLLDGRVLTERDLRLWRTRDTMPGP